VDNDYARGVPVPDDNAIQAQAQQAAQQAQGIYDPNNPAAATMIDPATGQPVAAPVGGQVPPMQGQPIQGQPVQGQPMPGQVMPGQPAMRPVQNNSTGNADGASNR
jgi:type IV secretion system protein VirB8